MHFDNINQGYHIVIFNFLVQVRLRQKYHARQVGPNWGSNPSPPDHDRTFYVTGTPALTTQPSVTNHIDAKKDKSKHLNGNIISHVRVQVLRVNNVPHELIR